jgi:glyoxylase-like metal-dependent hydrolase (beta-lactamase superfamily II)
MTMETLAAMGPSGKWLAAMGVAAGAILLAKRLALDSSPVPESSEFPIRLADWRTQASVDRLEELPVRLNALMIAEVTTRRGAVVAGGGLAKQVMAMGCFQVEYPDRTYIIDSVYDRSTHETMNRRHPYIDESFKRLQYAMLRAEKILLTHEHADHVGGIANSPVYDQIASKLMLTREQIESPAIARSGYSRERLKALTPLVYETTYQVGPGVLLIKLPGHSPGSQSIFVHLKDGREFLLIGDIAWSMDNIRQLRGRPWLISRFMIHEDRAQVASQTRALYNLLSDASNEVEIVPSHDAALLRSLIHKRVIREGFN